MRQTGIRNQLLILLAYVVAVRLAAMLWSDWLGLLVLLPLPFYLIHFLLRRLWPGNHDPVTATLRYLRLRAWYRSRRTDDKLDSPAHKPRGFCPKCGYAVNPGRCPECGHEVTRRNVRVERYGPLHRHRRKLISAGVAVFVILAGYLFFTRVNWVSPLPFDAVVTLHRWGNDDARDELKNRVLSQSLSKAQLNVLYEATVVPRLSIPQPYPHDAQVPCDLRFDMTMRCLYPHMGSPLYFIRNCTCEVDGKLIEHDFPPDDSSEAGTVFSFVLPPTEPGVHVVRVRGEVACSGCPDLTEVPHYVVCRIPFDVEIAYETDVRTAAEMIEVEKLVLRIEPDPREAATGSKMQSRCYYGKTLDTSARRPSVVSAWKASSPPEDDQ